MTDYRVFPLSGDGFIDWGRQRGAETDAEALGLASGMLDRHPAVEVWHAGRCIARLDCGTMTAHAGGASGLPLS